MPRLPQATPEDVARVARRAGFLQDRQRGSHAVWVHPTNGRRIVIPMHCGDLKRGTLRGIVADMGLTVDEFIRLL